MKSYLPHLTSAYSQKTFQRKIEYIRYNIFPHFPSSSGLNFLEIGPGLGEFVAACGLINKASVDIVDIDNTVLEHVASKYTASHVFQTKNIALIDKKLGMYDGIVGVQVLEHIPPEQYEGMLEVLLRHIKPGGKIIFVVPNANNPLGIVERYGDLQHYKAFTTRSLHDLVSLVDTSELDIKVAGYHIPPTDILNCIRIVLQKILHGILLGILIVNSGVFFSVMTPNSMLVITKRATRVKGVS